jgi:hypothetical protein
MLLILIAMVLLPEVFRSFVVWNRFPSLTDPIHDIRIGEGGEIGNQTSTATILQMYSQMVKKHNQSVGE